MTKRLAYPAAWAQNGQAVDPDLDTTHPSYEANRYATKGWHSEKPPEQWQNFLSQISDLKVLGLLVDGIQQWDAGVTYELNALSKVAGVVYIRVAVVTPVVSPELAGSGWDELVDQTALGFNNLVQGLIDKLSVHNAASNPHDDDIHNVVGGGYLKTEVNPKFNSATDPNTIVYHMGQSGQIVHGETVAQIGTLSAVEGGTFSGPVIFEDDAIIQVSPSKVVHLNRATALLEMANGTVSLGIAANGVGYVVTTAGMFVVMSEDNYDQLNMVQNGQFALPVPVWSMNLQQSLSDAEGRGNWVVNSEASPVFTKFGLTLTDNPIHISYYQPLAVTAHVVAYDIAGTKLVAILDYDSAISYGTTINSLLADAFNLPTAVYFKSMVFYPQLTANQKSMLEKA